jgi:hypothetical protein
LVSTKGIEASPNKIKAIHQMHPPQTRKEVQKLAGRIAELNRFIAKLEERSTKTGRPSMLAREGPAPSQVTGETFAIILPLQHKIIGIQQ